MGTLPQVRDGIFYPVLRRVGMYDVVAGMQSFPFSLRQAAAMVVVLLLPFEPLLLTAMSLKQLLQRLLGMVV